MKDPINVYLIVDNELGKPVKTYLTENNAIKEIPHWNIYSRKNYSLYKYAPVAIRKNDEWVDVPEQA